MTVPPDLQARLKKSLRASRFFEQPSSQNWYPSLCRLQDAKKPETRERRLEKFVRMLEAHETLH